MERQFKLAALHAQVIDYFDDFLILCSGPKDPTQSASLFTTLSSQVELRIKVAKKKQGSVASFGGVELDTGKMIVRLPLKKLEKARTIVRTAIEKHSLLLLEIQKITGYLNFVAVVVPLGGTFLRRLDNMELYFPSQGISYRRRISQEARRDLTWWSKVLANSPERSIMSRERNEVATWSDAASTKGLGGYFLLKGESSPKQSAAFAIQLPRHLARSREHINTQEMRAVEQVLL